VAKIQEFNINAGGTIYLPLGIRGLHFQSTLSSVLVIRHQHICTQFSLHFMQTSLLTSV